MRLLEQPEPFAVAVGWRRPVILVSQGLVAGLSERGLAVVLAHERAHIARGDTRLAVVDRLAASILPGRVAAPLLRRISLAREQACDAIAARQSGGPLAVAQALAEVIRLGVRAPTVGVSIASGAVESRVAYLLATPRRERRWRIVVALTIAGLIAAGMGPVHSVAEALVTLLLHGAS